jgi:hypothetical protein
MVENQSSSATSSDFFLCYREKDRNLAVETLLSGSSLLSVGTGGIGKTMLIRFIVSSLEAKGLICAVASPASAKQFLTEIAFQLGLIEEDEKIPTTTQLQWRVADYLSRNENVVLVCDDAHRLQISLRCWLEELLSRGHRLLLAATLPPSRDIFLKLPRIELQPLPSSSIRAVMQEAADELGVELTPAQISSLQERCGGNPMLAKRVVREHSLGMQGDSLDHTQWIDGTPLILAALLAFTVLRFIGRGMQATDLYLVGGIITVAIGIFRLLLWSLPRKSNRLGA